MGKKNPILAALLNFLLIGLGYIYVGKRMAFGILLVIYAVLLFMVPFVGQLYSYFLVSGLGLLLAIAMAYDGYQDAKENNSKK